LLVEDGQTRQSLVNESKTIDDYMFAIRGVI
jgi:hypothetical protein